MAERVHGIHSIEERLRKGVSGARLLVSRQGPRLQQLRQLAESHGVEVSEVADAELDDLIGSNAHRGAVLLLERNTAGSAFDLNRHLGGLHGEKALAMVLDGITDPQNLGAILRSADQFAAELVVIPSRRSARETETVSRVSSGASVYVPLAIVPNIATALERLKESGFWIYGADIAGEPLDRVSFSEKACLVMGSEGFGMRRLVREKCDHLIRIPASGHVDSFNVSVAAGILMFEVRRQQGFPNNR